jgi:DNA modification methylase
MKLYNGDCLKVMQELIDNKEKVDFVFTSPPYNRIRNDKYKNHNDNLSNDNYYLFLLKTIELSLELSGYVFFNIQQTYFNTKIVHKIIGHFSEYIINNIIWEKLNPQPNNNIHSVINSYEYILVLSKKHETLRAKILGTKNLIITPVFSQNQYSNIHNAVMHPYVSDWFVEHFTDKGDVILDCFMGTGTTGISCISKDRDFIGIELDKQYYEVSKKRIESIDIQESLF